MKRASLLAMLAVVLTGSVACNRQTPSGPDTALDRAYKAGILSTEEYQAKKAAQSLAAASPAPAPASAAPAPVPSPAPAAATPVVRASRPKPVAIPSLEAPAPEPVARHENRPEPPAVDRDEDAPAPTSACAGNEVRPGKEKGLQERFYPMPLARVRAAVMQALKDLEFNVRRASDTELEAGKKRHIGLLGSGGEKMMLQFEEAVQGNQRGTRVTGETKKNIVMRAGQKSWTNAVLDQANCNLHANLRAGN